MQPNKKWQQGDIWWVQCDPSTGSEFQGRRPAVVIQHAKTARKDCLGIVTLVLLSSYKGKQWAHDILVQPSSHNNLRTASLIKVQHIVGFDVSRLRKKIGVLDDSHFVALKKYLRQHFDL